MHVLDCELEMYILEKLPRSQQSAISFHLAACSACQSRLADSAKVFARLAALSSHSGPYVRERRRFIRFATDEPVSVRILNPVSFARDAARVLDTSRDGLKLRVSEFLAPGSTIQVRLANAIAFGEIRYCKPVGSGFHVGVQLQDTFPAPCAEPELARRKSPRHSLSVTGALRVNGTSDERAITILDVSTSGLRIRCDTAIASGTRVEVAWGDTAACGEIRYCREIAADGFNVGINIDGVSGPKLEQEREMDLTLLFNLV